MHCDVTPEADAAGCRRAGAERAFGGLDALVNNAGIVDGHARAGDRDPRGRVGHGDGRERQGHLADDPGGDSRASTGAGGGAIVNLASETAYTGSHGMSHYVASKAAVIGLTRAFARELGPLGIRVNAIAPGYTDTEGGRAIGDPATYDVSATPLGRVAEPDDMVGTLLHLLGPGSAFVTGQVVLVNGGRVYGLSDSSRPTAARATCGSTPSSSR